jgi:antitoxin MazE
VIKTLKRVGNSLGLIIDRPILDLLKITPETPLDISVTPDGRGLVIRPLEPEDHRVRVRASAERMMDIHDGTLRKLAE